MFITSTFSSAMCGGGEGAPKRVFLRTGMPSWRGSCSEFVMLRTEMACLVLVLFASKGVCADVLGGFPDPTRPIGNSTTAPREIREPHRYELEATFISAERKLALISGRYVAVGDVVGDAIVTDIRAYEVVLSSRQGQRTMRLLPRLVKPARVVGVVPIVPIGQK